MQRIEKKRRKKKWKRKKKTKHRLRRASFLEKRNAPITLSHASNGVVIFQLVFYLQWMQFSQHSEAVSFYHGHSNPIGRAAEIPHISIYMSSLRSIPIQGGTAAKQCISNEEIKNSIQWIIVHIFFVFLLFFLTSNPIRSS